MQTLIVSNDLTVVLYDSIEQYPIWLESEARQYVMIQSGLASNEAELEEKQGRIDLFEQAGKQAECLREKQNYQLSEYLISIDFNAQELEWACYIHAINGVPVEDYSEDELMKRLTYLKENGLTTPQISDSLQSIKAGMQREIKRFFPSHSTKGKQANNLTRYKAYGVGLANYYENPNEQTKQELDRVTLELALSQEVYSFGDDQTNVLAAMKLAQHSSFAVLTESGVMNPSKLTVFEYYAWIDVLKKRYEEQTKMGPPSGLKPNGPKR